MAELYERCPRCDGRRKVSYYSAGEGECPKCMATGFVSAGIDSEDVAMDRAGVGRLEGERDALQAEVSRLKAQHSATLETLARVRERHEEMGEECRRLEGERDEASRERDAVVGSYYTCRKVLQDAGIPCQFGKDGEPTTDEGTGRDLADCVRSLIERMRAAEGERDALEVMPIAPALGGHVARIPWRKGGYPHGEFLNSGGYWFGSWDLARKAVRLAAGLEGEG